MPEEIFNMMMAILGGSAANTDSPTTMLNRYENFFDVLGISPEMLTGTTWPSYTQPIPFDETPYLNKTLRYLNSTTPAWQNAAQGLMTGNYTAADAYYEVSKALGGDLAYDKEFIQKEISAMETEIAERNKALADYNRSVAEDQRSNIYGKAGLPQPYEEFGFGEGQTPPPASEITRETQNFIMELMNQLDESGYNKAMADKPEAKTRKIVKAVEKYYKENPDAFYRTTGRDRRYTVTPEYQVPGSTDELGRPRTSGGIRYTHELVAPNDEQIKEIGDRIRLLSEKSTQPTTNPLSRMIRAGFGQALEKVTPGYDKIEADLKRIYGPVEQKGFALKARIGEQSRNLDFLRTLDLLSAQRAGKTPLSEAQKERFGSVVLPFLMNLK